MTMTLSGIAGTAGGIFALTGLSILLKPDAVRRAVSAFPRHVWIGRVLMAFALVWVTAIVLRAELGRFTFVKPYLYVLTPVAIGCVGWLLAELLAPRALGGLLLLAANPVLSTARWEDTPWRLAISVAAYLAVISGTFLVVGPHWFRRCFQPALATTRRSAGLGILLLAAGLFFLWLAMGPYHAP